MKHERYIWAAIVVALLAICAAWFIPSARMRPCEGRPPFSCWEMQ